MKSAIFILCCLGLTVIAGDTSSPHVIRAVARYRITPAKVSVATPEGRMLELQTVFKLDAQTGDTWIYKAKTSTSNLIEGWERLQDLR